MGLRYLWGQQLLMGLGRIYGARGYLWGWDVLKGLRYLWGQEELMGLGDTYGAEELVGPGGTYGAGRNLWG